MSKKQELVQEVINRLVNSGVDFGQLKTPLGEQLDPRSSNVPWDVHPDGYYNFDGNLDELLSTLEVENLEAILADTTPIMPGTLLGDIWFDWGDNLYLRSVPKLLDVRAVPVLRLRHDNYLALFREAGFQVSKDAYEHTTAGISWLSLGTALNLLRDWQKWPTEHGGEDFVRNTCTLMILGYICNAGQELRSFYKVLAEHPELIDEFMWKTDEKFWKLGLENGLGVKDLRRHLVEAEPCDGNKRLASLHLCDKGQMFATLRYYENAVQLDWDTTKGTKRFVAHFPKWVERLYIAESTDDSNIERPTYLDKERYVYLCWDILTQTLTTFAGIVHNSKWCCYRKMRSEDGSIRSIATSLFDEYWCCNGFGRVYEILGMIAKAIAHS